GESVTISGDSAEQLGLTVLTLRPLHVAALQTICGMPPSSPPRLSDPSAFEMLHNTDDDLVDVTQPDSDGRIDGYSANFIRNVLSVLEPDDPMPESVRWLCSRPLPQASAGSCEPRSTADHRNSVPLRSPLAAVEERYLDVEVPVPVFLREFRAVTSTCISLRDLVVGANSTLILHKVSSLHVY